MKITFCGAHGTGKSTLVEALAKNSRFKDYKIIDGIARKLPSGWKDKQNQAYVNSQYLLQHGLNSNFISARSIYDAWAYSRVNHGLTFYYKRFSLGSRLINYDYLFYVPIEFKLIDDKVRPLDELYQRKIDEEISTLIINRYKGTIVCLQGTIEQRINKMFTNLHI